MGLASLSSFTGLYLEGDWVTREQGRLGTRRPLLVGVGNEAQGLGPEAQKPLPFNFSSQIILEAEQRVPWALLPSA